MITITETLYKKMPDDIKACFNQLPNPSSEEVRECFPDTKSGKLKSDCYEKDRKNDSMFAGGENFTHKGYEADSGNASRFFKSIVYVPKPSKKERNAGCEGLEEKRGGSMEANTTDKMQLGGASLKGEPKKIQSTKNNHPTVKPIALMEYLIKMITPKGGTVLDPFMGSGSTGVAAIQNDFDFIGIDMTPEYIEIAKARINHAKKIKDNKLF
jgi:site-specific DNA-methyltransferase (adenine-specific)